jgi:hypothetical protein
MTETSMEPEAYKDALKQLKAARQEQIAAATGRMKAQRRAVKAIKEALAESELTVPELAEATALPVSEVMWYVATLKKYGDILEGPKDSGYYRYRLAPAAAADAGPGENE